MRLHGNARTCPRSRRLFVGRTEDQGWSVARAARAAGISERTACKWLARYRGEGEDGLDDRASAPRRIRHRTPGRSRGLGRLSRLGPSSGPTATSDVERVSSCT